MLNRHAAEFQRLASLADSGDYNDADRAEAMRRLAGTFAARLDALEAARREAA